MPGRPSLALPRAVTTEEDRLVLDLLDLIRRTPGPRKTDHNGRLIVPFQTYATAVRMVLSWGDADGFRLDTISSLVPCRPSAEHSSCSALMARIPGVENNCATERDGSLYRAWLSTPPVRARPLARIAGSSARLLASPQVVAAFVTEVLTWGGHHTPKASVSMVYLSQVIPCRPSRGGTSFSEFIARGIPGLKTKPNGSMWLPLEEAPADDDGAGEETGEEDSDGGDSDSDGYGDDGEDGGGWLPAPSTHARHSSSSRAASSAAPVSSSSSGTNPTRLSDRLVLDLLVLLSSVPGPAETDSNGRLIVPKDVFHEAVRQVLGWDEEGIRYDNLATLLPCRPPGARSSSFRTLMDGIDGVENDFDAMTTSSQKAHLTSPPAHWSSSPPPPRFAGTSGRLLVSAEVFGTFVREALSWGGHVGRDSPMAILQLALLAPCRFIYTPSQESFSLVPGTAGVFGQQVWLTEAPTHPHLHRGGAVSAAASSSSSAAAAASASRAATRHPSGTARAASSAAAAESVRPTPSRGAAAAAAAAAAAFRSLASPPTHPTHLSDRLVLDLLALLWSVPGPAETDSNGRLIVPKDVFHEAVRQVLGWDEEGIRYDNLATLLPCRPPGVRTGPGLTHTKMSFSTVMKGVAGVSESSIVVKGVEHVKVAHLTSPPAHWASSPPPLRTAGTSGRLVVSPAVVGAFVRQVLSWGGHVGQEAATTVQKLCYLIPCQETEEVADVIGSLRRMRGVRMGDRWTTIWLSDDYDGDVISAAAADKAAPVPVRRGVTAPSSSSSSSSSSAAVGASSSSSSWSAVAAAGGAQAGAGAGGTEAADRLCEELFDMLRAVPGPVRADDVGRLIVPADVFHAVVRHILSWQPRGELSLIELSGMVPCRPLSTARFSALVAGVPGVRVSGAIASIGVGRLPTPRPAVSVTPRGKLVASDAVFAACVRQALSWSAPTPIWAIGLANLLPCGPASRSDFSRAVSAVSGVVKVPPKGHFTLAPHLVAAGGAAASSSSPWAAAAAAAAPAAAADEREEDEWEREGEEGEEEGAWGWEGGLDEPAAAAPAATPAATPAAGPAAAPAAARAAAPAAAPAAASAAAAYAPPPVVGWAPPPVAPPFGAAAHSLAASPLAAAAYVPPAAVSPLEATVLDALLAGAAPSLRVAALFLRLPPPLAGPLMTFEGRLRAMSSVRVVTAGHSLVVELAVSPEEARARAGGRG
jgi:hypothetical protein